MFGRSWAKVKVMMAKVDQFLDSLVNYDKENINANILTALEVYLKDKGYTFYENHLTSLQ